jgi:hypothetical protein
MRSHLIPSRPNQGVWDRSVKRGFRVFVEDRTKLIIKALESEAGLRLFEGSS